MLELNYTVSIKNINFRQTMNILEAIEQWKQIFLSPFCLKTCGGHCCKNSNTKIEISKNQIKEILKLNERSDLKITARHNWDKPNHYFMKTYENETNPHCPAFCPKNKSCLIQHLKPQMCLDFPIIIKEEEIILHRRCQLWKVKNEALEKLKQICQEFNYSLYIE